MSCAAAADARAWRMAQTLCFRDPDYVTLAAGWLAGSDGRPDDALAIGTRLADGGLPDGAYLAGHVLSHSKGPDDAARAQVWFVKAFVGFHVAGRHRDAALTAGFQCRLSGETYRFDDALAWAAAAVEEARLDGDAPAQGRAGTAAAEIFDRVGLSEEAELEFIRAEGLLASSPADLAFAHLKHGLLLLDLGGERNLRHAIDHLDDSAAIEARATRPITYAFSRALNRADALIQLGDYDAAEAALALVATDDDERRMLELVRGYLAARRDDLPAAEQAFAKADADELALDFRWRIGFELGSAYQRKGRLVDADRAYAEAIASVELLRQAADAVELRPRVLANRTQPYVGRFEVLVAQGRPLEALAVAESLQGRTWLDVILARPGASTDVALRDAQVRARIPARDPLDASTLMARVGDREALVFLTMGKTTWRAHVVGGAVSFDALKEEDLDAADAFTARPADVAAAERAGTALLRDVKPGSAPLYIVASGRLADVPFPGLRRDGRFLIEDRVLARLPGLAALGCRPGRWTGDRIYAGDANGDLPEAEREVRRLGGPAALVGRQVNRAALIAARDADLLYVAVHGLVGPTGGVLMLADGPFGAADVLASGLAPRTVMLTGCSTAATSDAEAWNGFPSAFLAAGSEAVIATLRPVIDADAAAFSLEYSRHATDDGPAARLAATQRVLARSNVPVAWWSFAVWGDAACSSGG